MGVGAFSWVFSSAARSFGERPRSAKVVTFVPYVKEDSGPRLRRIPDAVYRETLPEVTQFLRETVKEGDLVLTMVLAVVFLLPRGLIALPAALASLGKGGRDAGA